MPESIIGKLDRWFNQIERRETVLIAEKKTKLAFLFQRWLENKYQVQILSTESQLTGRISYSANYLLIDRYFSDDINMLLDKVKSKYPNLPIILLTGVNPELDRMEPEVDDYIVKPVDKSKIMETIESVEIKQRERGLMEN